MYKNTFLVYDLFDRFKRKIPSSDAYATVDQVFSDFIVRVIGKKSQCVIHK